MPSRLLLFTLLTVCANGQTFDVASIKPAAPPTPNGRGMITMRMPSGGPGTKDPGRVNFPFTNLRSLITIAYDVKNYQVSGPPTIDSEHFEVQATMPPDTTKEQYQIMLQNLLAERFQLKIHRDTRDLPQYTLVIGKKGSKLKESAAAPPPVDKDAPPMPPAFSGPLKMGPDGFPIFPSMNRQGFSQIMMNGRARMTAQNVTMSEFTTRLSMILDKPVSDATGLAAKYDFTVTYLPENLNRLTGLPMPPPPPGGAAGPAPPASDADPLPDLFTAIQLDLGLKLEAKKGPVSMIVVDHVEKTPTEN